MVSCGTGTAKCGDGCVDTKIDPRNCGDCGKTCPAGQACAGSQCTSKCAPSQTLCSPGGIPSCVNTDTDNANCGICEHACDAGTVCSKGSCNVTCGMGLLNCAGTCVDPQTSSEHCGASGGCSPSDAGPDAGTAGVSCPIGQTCAGGSCSVTCSTGTSACGSQCVDLSSDRDNCGACGASCNQKCIGGICKHVFTGDFRSDQPTQPAACFAWQVFEMDLVGSTYSSVTISGTFDTTGVTCTGAGADQLCRALATGIPIDVTCDGRSWAVGGCGSVTGDWEISASGPTCGCRDPQVGYTVRPCLSGSPNFGGAGTPDCFAPSQTLKVTCY